MEEGVWHDEELYDNIFKVNIVAFPLPFCIQSQALQLEYLLLYCYMLLGELVG
jgi:hypothetical protein